MLVRVDYMRTPSGDIFMAETACTFVLVRVRSPLEGACYVPHLRVILEGRHPYIAQPGDLVHPNISIVTQNAYRRSLGCMSLYPPPLIRIQPTYTGPHNGFKYKQQPRLPCMGDRTQRIAMQRNAMQRNDTVDRMDRPRKA